MPTYTVRSLKSWNTVQHRSFFLGWFATLALAFLLTACESPDGLQPGHDAKVQLREEYPDVSIKRVGDYNSSVEDYHDVAILRAFKKIEGSGIPRERIESVVIDTPVIGGLSGGFSFPSFGVPSHYDIWVTIADCEKQVFFKASGTGFLQSFRDQAGCLSQEQG